MRDSVDDKTQPVSGNGVSTRKPAVVIPAESRHINKQLKQTIIVHTVKNGKVSDRISYGLDKKILRM